MEILTYPNYLANDEYALRKVVFTAMKNDACETEAGQMLQKALTTAADAVENTWDSIVNNDVPMAPEGFTSVGQIVLPIPAQINDESSHKWNAETSIVSELIKTAASAATAILPGGVAKIASTMAPAVNAAGGFDKILATSAMLTSRRKPLIDPGYFQNYSGTDPRTFTMQWNLIPQNAEDSRTIHNIIMTFKKWSSPSKAIAGVVMLSPFFFNIQLSNPMISNMLKMDNCVCTRVECSYSSQIFPDGMPKQISLSLSFNEASLTYADNYGSVVGTSQSGSSNSTPKVNNNPNISVVNR